MALIFAVAFTARLGASLAGGGLVAIGIYDDAVYFTSASRWIAGSMPYRDYLLLHPPGMTVWLAPWAFLSRMTTDPQGFAAARLFEMVISSGSAVLLYLLASQWGRLAGWIAGLTYAFFRSSIAAGATLYMEGLGSFLALAAIALLTIPVRRGRIGAAVLAGCLLGIFVTLKIWNAPIAIVVLFAAKWGRPLAAAALAAISTSLAIYLPFFIAAPQAMWRMVVVDQLGRARSNPDLLVRWARYLGVSEGPSAALVTENGGRLLSLATAAIVLLSIVVYLWRRTDWMYLALLLLTGTVLSLSPMVLVNYGEFAAPWLALVVAGGLGRLPLLPGNALAWLLVPTWIGLLAVGGLQPIGRSVPVRWLSEHLAGARCVVADDPIALIATDRLTSQLNTDCQAPRADVSGATYDYAKWGDETDRTRNPVWQREIVQYVTSSDAAILCRKNTGVSAGTVKALEEALVGKKAGFAVYRFSER